MEATTIYNQATLLRERCAPGVSGQGALFAFNKRHRSARKKVWGNVKVMQMPKKDETEVSGGEDEEDEEEQNPLRRKGRLVRLDPLGVSKTACSERYRSFVVESVSTLVNERCFLSIVLKPPQT